MSSRLLGLVLFILSYSTAHAIPFINGHFSNGLNGWGSIGDVSTSHQPDVVNGSSYALLSLGQLGGATRQELEAALDLPQGCLEVEKITRGSAVWQDVFIGPDDDLEFSFQILSNGSSADDFINQVFLTISDYSPSGQIYDPWVIEFSGAYEDATLLAQPINGYSYSFTINSLFNIPGMWDQNSISTESGNFRIGFLITDGLPGTGADSALAIRMATSQPVPELDPSAGTLPLAVMILITLLISDRRIRSGLAQE